MTDYYETSYPPSLWEPAEPPELLGIAPAAGVQGTTVTITLTGTGFIDGVSVPYFNGVAVPSYTWVSETSMTIDGFVIPNSLGSKPVTVHNGSAVSNAWNFSVTAVTSVKTTPWEFTIAEIQTWVDANPDDADEVLDAEQSRGTSARVTLVDWLQGFISHRDEGTLP